MISHPDREQVVQEMLLRRFPHVSAPMTLIQLVRLVAPTDRDAEAAAVRALPQLDALTVMPGGRHADARTVTGDQLLWERQSEASTLSILLHGLYADVPTGQPQIDALVEAVAAMPGDVVRATLLLVVATEADAQGPLKTLGIDPATAVTCRINGSCLWSEFKLYPDGYGRMVIAANGALPSDLGRTVQSIQELGNYRNLALLGLSVARRNRERLDVLESELSEHARDVANGTLTDETILNRLSMLSAELSLISSSTAFRMNATAAYAAIVEDRLGSLPQERLPGCQTLTDFTDRRLTPAVRTCENFGLRLEQLAERAARITALLRTRIETRIEDQNSKLLASMEQGIGLQVRFGGLVEGLSFLALSYYAVGLLSYLFKGAFDYHHRTGPELAIAASVIPVAVIIFFFLRHQRAKLNKQK